MSRSRKPALPWFFQPTPIKLRTCLKCNKEFPSQGNRIGHACTKENDDVRVKSSKRDQRPRGSGTSNP